MPSTYTTNLGIEKPGDGEQDGIWGDIVNENSDILDRAINGTLFLTLSGTASTLTTADGILSNGQYKLLALQGTPSGTHTITIAPNDAQKIYFVRNLTAQTVIFTQGSGGNYTLLAGDSAIINTSGTGATASVSSFTDHLAMSSPNITGGALSNVTIDTATITGGTISGAAITGVTDINVDGGTAAAPGYTFSTDLNTGMYSAGADSIGFSTGGTNRLLLSNTALQTTFAGTEALPAYSFTTDTNTGMYSLGSDLLGFSVAGSELLRLSTGGAQIFGATTETKALEIGIGRAGNGAAILDLIGDATYNDYGTRLIRGGDGPNGSTVLSHRGTGNFALQAVDAGYVTVQTSSQERMRVAANGYVGIGTTAPTVMLDVAGTGNFGGGLNVYGSFNTSSIVEVGTLGTGDRNSVIDFHSSGAAGSLDYSARIIRTPGANGQLDTYNTGSGNLNWVVNGVTRMTIFGSNGRPYLSASGSRGATGYVLTTQTDSVSNAFRAPGYIEWSTDVGAVGTNYFLSDVRKKENISPSVQSSADLINQIDFIQFDWKPESGNTGHVNVGVSAQQLQGIDARLVNELSDGGLMVSEPALIAHIAKALQEALTKITALEARITALEA